MQQIQQMFNQQLEEKLNEIISLRSKVIQLQSRLDSQDNSQVSSQDNQQRQNPDFVRREEY